MGIDVKLGPEAAWKATLGELELQMTKATFNSWLKGTRLGRVDTEGGKLRFVIYVRNEYAKEWLENRLYDHIARTLCAITGEDVALKFQEVQDGSPPPPEMPMSETVVNGNGVGSGGNVSDEVRNTVHQSTSGDYYKTNRGGRRGDEPVEFRNIRKSKNPLKGFVQLSHYAVRFWQPYIGPPAFAFLVLISSYAYEFEVLKQKGPSLKLMGMKTRGGENAIRGRAATGKTPAQDGLLDVLRTHLICNHESEGVGRGMRHYFDYLTKVEDLPLLTPKQVASLPEVVQSEHRQWLEMHGIDISAWEKDKRETQLEMFPEVESA